MTEFKPSIGEYPKHLCAVYVDLEKKTAIFYTGRQSKHTWYNRFQTVDDMKEKIIKTITRLMEWEDRKLERKEARKAASTVKVGDIFYTSWGYDQTNVNFYKVVSVRGKQTVELREIGSKIVSTDGGPTTHVTAEDRFINDKVLTKRVVENKVKITDYATGWLWDGQPKYETAYGWGH